MIVNQQSHLPYAASTHVGKKRRVNEDRYTVRAYHLEENGVPALLAVVADGIGGHQAGDVAAQLTVDTITHGVAAFQSGDPLPCLQSAIIEAGRVVSSNAAESADLAGMGSTAAVALIIGPRLYTVTVGDSRIYLLRQGRLRQISIDHTWVQEAIDYDIISPEDAKDHPQAHVLRRHIGGKQLPEPDIRMPLEDGENDRRAILNQGTPIKRGDRILLCTDGLTDLVADLEIYQVLKEKPVEEAAETLLNLALEHGGLDNITLIVLAAPRGKLQETPRSKFKSLLTAAFSSLILIIITALALAAVWWFGFWPWSP
ncbi:MAG: serine/threonine-protein phosphatase [Anaerolineales bacterium]|nr:serine/threonine-protein phosphatase [Anaerolineales bacterium]